MLTREQLLAANKRRFKVLTLPGMGPVRIRSLTERERAKFEAEHLEVTTEAADGDTEGLQEAKRKLIVLMVCDADGNQLLAPTDMDLLGDLDGAVTGFLFDECKTWAGIGTNAKTLDTILGNSKATTGGDSP